MPTLQARTDNNNEPLVLADEARVRQGITLEAAQGDLVAGAVLAEVTADPGVYILIDDVAAVDGTRMPKLILAEDVANDAGQQAGISAYEQGLFAEEKLSFGGAVDLDSRIVMSAADFINITVRDALRMMGIDTAPTVSLSGFENA